MERGNTRSTLSQMALDLTATAPVFFPGFGETITVVPPGGAATYTVTAVVDRDQPGPMDQDGTVAASMVVVVRNHATLGIAGASLNTRSWRLRIPLQVGQAASERPIRRLVSQDAGCITLEVG